MDRESAQIDVAAILITESKAAYIRDSHGVGADEVLEAFANQPRYFVDERGRFAMIGPLRSGRFLLAAIAPVEAEGSLWRLITAHWLATNQARAIYGED